MKIDSGLSNVRIGSTLTQPATAPKTDFSARVSSAVGTAANVVAGGLSVASNMVPGASVLSTAVSSLSAFSGASGSGAAPYYSAASAGAGAVPVSGGVSGGAPVSNNGSVSLPGGGGVSGGEFNGEMQSMFSEQKKLLGVQISMQRENQVFSTISNVLKTRHDTSKNAIGNIR
ncbi:MAG TPA: hypothetical protein VLQ93_12160 [Myxococcaceae bacterium]|nr:hypothetical protein [Myxococcaceae bacterium]